jgi:hypothetical protein
MSTDKTDIRLWGCKNNDSDNPADVSFCIENKTSTVSISGTNLSKKNKFETKIRDFATNLDNPQCLYSWIYGHCWCEAALCAVYFDRLNLPG